MKLSQHEKIEGEEFRAGQYNDENIDLYIKLVLEYDFISDEAEFLVFDSCYCLKKTDGSTVLFLKPAVLKGFFIGFSSIDDILFHINQLMIAGSRIKVLSAYHLNDWAAPDLNAWQKVEKQVTNEGHWLTFEMDLEKSTNNWEAKVYLHDPFGGGRLAESHFNKLSQTINEYLSTEHDHIYTVNENSPYHVCRQHDATSCGVIVAHEVTKRVKGEALNGNYPARTENLRILQIQKIKLHLGEDHIQYKHFRNKTFKNGKIYPRLKDPSTTTVTENTKMMEKIANNKAKLEEFAKTIKGDIREIYGEYNENLLNWAVFHKNTVLVKELVEKYYFDLSRTDKSKRRTPICYATEILSTKRQSLSKDDQKALLEIILYLITSREATYQMVILEDIHGNNFLDYFTNIKKHLLSQKDTIKLIEEALSRLKINQILEEDLTGISQLTLDDQRYKLHRTDSDMSAYTDLVSDILDDQLGVYVNEDRRDDYNVESAKKESPERQELKESLERKKEAIKAQAKNDISYPKKIQGETPQKLAGRRRSFTSTKINSDPECRKMKEQIKSLEAVDMSFADTDKKMHLFRGKCLNSRILGDDGKLRSRTKSEIEDYVTKRHTKGILYSDGAATIKNDQAKYEIAKEKTRKFIQEIKENKRNTALFNAGDAYSKAVKDLMALTGLKGNAVVATSKLPEIAAEYMVGQMGGAAGGDRKIEPGYSKSKKPIRRFLGNGFAVSISLKEYETYRQHNDLIDVNVDLGKGVKVNQVIEEVTFVMDIPAHMVHATLPMILPRFDREYKEMSNLKKRQYKRVFGLSEEKYVEFQKDFKDKVPLGKITEYMIVHYGLLLREIAIQADRKAGYHQTFVITKNDQYQGYVEDIRTPYKLRSRAARTNNAIKDSDYFEEEKCTTTTNDSIDTLVKVLEIMHIDDVRPSKKTEKSWVSRISNTNHKRAKSFSL